MKSRKQTLIKENIAMHAWKFIFKLKPSSKFHAKLINQ